MTRSGGELVTDLQLRPNEASGLLRVDDPDLLRRRGWDMAFWSVLDEVNIADCVALIGHGEGRPPNSGWDIARLAASCSGYDGAADDAEALARHAGWVYLLGSHHGGKRGPIRESEQWLARFAESAVVDGEAGQPTVRLTVVHTAFRLHRLINDALADCGVPLLEMRPATRAAFVDATIEQLADTPAAGLVRSDDWTINIEGAEFTAEGGLLLGLRFPVAADGRPLLVRLDGIEGLFETPASWPRVAGVWSVDAVGRGGTTAGVRDLCRVGDRLHLVTGDLDSAGKGSVLREEYPEGGGTVNTHFETALDSGSQRLAARAVREFAGFPRIEGIAADNAGQFFYVSDEEDAVRLHGTPLLTGD